MRSKAVSRGVTSSTPSRRCLCSPSDYLTTILQSHTLQPLHFFLATLPSDCLLTLSQMLVRSINEGRTLRGELEGFALKRPTEEGWSGGGGGGGGGRGGARWQGGGRR